MKKLSLFALLLVMAVCFSSCDNARQRLIREIEHANTDCPMDLGIMGSLSSIVFDEATNTVIANVDYNEEYLPFEYLQKSEKEMQNGMRLTMATDENMRIVAQAIHDGKANFCYAFHGNQSGKTLDLKFSNSQIGEILSHEYTPHETDLLMYENIILVENARCPMSVDEITTLTKVSDQGSYELYEYIIDDSGIEELIEYFAIDAKDLKDELGRELANPLSKSQLRCMVNLDKSLVYRYTGTSSGLAFDIEFTPDELRQILASIP